eukprot:GFUD01017657.1.p1 GENE.GFUD01017657.1~~GFUD01017657.1.p1  ORF type:complete len:811 (-),score=228.30 GFUD01017657.1:63-2438(-)
MALTDEQRLRIEQKKAEAQARIKSRCNLPAVAPLTPIQPNLPKPSGTQDSSTSLVAELNKAAAQARQLVSAGQYVKPAPHHNSWQPVSTNSFTAKPASSSALSKPVSGLNLNSLNTQPVPVRNKNLTNFYGAPASPNSSTLSEQQKRLMDEKRKAALAKKQSQTQPTPVPVSLPPEMRKSNNTSNFYQPSPAFSGAPKVVKGSCSLISPTRFEVNVGFHDKLIQTFKAVDSAQYNAQQKTWTFDIMDHDMLIQKTNQLKPEVDVSPLPRWTLDTFKVPRTLLPDNIDISDIEQHLYEQLMPFQKVGIQYGVSRNGRVLIADDMGLGKTVQALGLASYYRQAWPVLVICPSTMRFSWEEAIGRWLPSVDRQDITVITTGKDFVGNAKFTVISYDLVKKKSEELKKKNFQFVIVDESHLIKDSRSTRAKAAEPLLKGSKYLVLLSGTPALSRPIELFSQLQVLDPRLFRWISDYGNRYCDGKMKRIGAGQEIPDYSGSSNMHELSLILHERCMVRRLKTEVLQQLPSKQRCMVVLDPAGVDTASKVMKEKKKENEKDELRGVERRGFILGWYNDTATAKLKAVKDYIKDLINTRDKKFLVFCHHQVMLKGVAETLEKLNVGFILIDGTVSSEKRKARVDQFQTDDKTKVALLSITAANAGITLTAAQLVVFAELFWNPGILTQAEDRAHRIGQTDSVVIQYLVARETADDVLWPLIQKKLEVLNKAGLSKDNFEDSEAKIMEDTQQHRIEDFFNKVDTEKVDTEKDLEMLWGDLTDEDFVFSQEESPPKKMKI